VNQRAPAPVQLRKTPGYQSVVDRVAANVRRLREVKGWTQEEAAHQCSGLHATLYRTVEAGRTNVTAATLARLSEGFGVDVVELFVPAPPLVKRRRGRPPKKANDDAQTEPVESPSTAPDAS
jgi:transcriptional regulator with XRE-family HTH domain